MSNARKRTKGGEPLLIIELEVTTNLLFEDVQCTLIKRYFKGVSTVGSIIEGYGTPVALKSLGLHSSQALNYWIKTNVIPVSKSLDGTRNVWTFTDLVAIRALGKLRDGGISLQQIRKVLIWLKGWGHALTDSYLVVVDGDVHLVESGGIISVLKQPGQIGMAVIIDLSTISREVNTIIASMAA